MSTRVLALAAFLFGLPGIAFPQASRIDNGFLQANSAAVSSSQAEAPLSAAPSIRRQSVHGLKLGIPPDGNFVTATMQRQPWDLGVFFGGGFAASGGTGDHFLSAGVRVGKVLTSPVGPGLLKGQFEYAGELIPYWQAFTTKQTYETPTSGDPPGLRQVTTGGTYTGLSLTPIILRWNLVHWKRWMPWLQGAGGLVWTDHKFPPNGAEETSVWNFTPQFGVGIHYFLKSNRALTFAANAVHISSASLGDSNPGVNATVQFQAGYTWWK